jgi:hypothetical protein
MSKKNRKSQKSRFKLNDSPARWKAIYKKFGLTRDAYNTILHHQRGCCAICNRSPDKIKPKRNLAVDHNHTTGEIRGLLCYRCNHVLLGRIFRDDVEMAKRAYIYLSISKNYGKVPE